LWTAIYPKLESYTNRREVRSSALALLFLLLVAGSLSLSHVARLGDWSLANLRWAHWLVLPVWAAVAVLLHILLRKRFHDRDPNLLPLLLLLSGWGTLAIWRLSPSYGLRQIGWFILSSLAIALILRGDPRLAWLRRYRYLWLAAGLGLMLLTLLAGTNPSGGDQRLWLGCCGVYLQPSEPLRLLLLAFLASFLADRLPISSRLGKVGSVHTLMPLLAVSGFSLLLLLAQRDLGTGLLFLALIVTLLIVGTGQWGYFWSGLALAGAGGVVGYYLFDVVRLRIDAWVNPWLDPTGRSYQIVQSLISIASGGVIGSGPGLGSPGFIPAAHTDFIFSSIVEEYGLLGGIALVACFALLLTCGLRIAVKHRDPFARLFSAGITLSLTLQALMIIGGNLRALPLVGITLPFISYGGSSLLTSAVGIGFLMVLSDRRQDSFPPVKTLSMLHGLGLAAWAGIALVLGWWTIYRAPALIARGDNPRRSVDGLIVRRGSVSDRNDATLAASVGVPGDYVRTYPEVEAAPVIGFDSYAFGQAGVEGSMDEVLRGLSWPDTSHVIWTQLTQGHPPPGQDIRLTIDAGFQQSAMELLDGVRGSVVLLQAGSGDILAMASQPSYDPNRLDETWDSLIRDPESPLLNRASQASYQPGTLLIPFELAGGIQLGLLDRGDPAPAVSAAYAIDSSLLRCSIPAPVAGLVSLEQSVRYACPGPFAELEVVDWEQLLAIYNLFDFDQEPALQLPASGPIGDLGPSPGRSLGDARVGQGALTLSPLQAAQAFAGLLAPGGMPGLRIVDAVRQEDGSWQRVPSMGHARIPLEAMVQINALDWMLTGPGGWLGYRALAISGVEGQEMAWFLGIINIEQAPIVVSVALEDASMIQAQTIGVQLLAATQGTPAP